MYELDRPAQQKSGTWQCWWLSFLELARSSGKLAEVFGPNGKFAGVEIPVEKGKDICGPAWQRVLMHHLAESGQWRYLPSSTMPTSSRKTELTKLAGLVGIRATFGSEINVVAFSIKTKLDGLTPGQTLVLDKKTKFGGHAISGVLVARPGARGMVRTIEAYCQQTKKSYTFKLTGTGNSVSLCDGDAKVNWLLPVS